MVLDEEEFRTARANVRKAMIGYHYSRASKPKAFLWDLAYSVVKSMFFSDKNWRHMPNWYVRGLLAALRFIRKHHPVQTKMVTWKPGLSNWRNC